MCRSSGSIHSPWRAPALLQSGPATCTCCPGWRSTAAWVCPVARLQRVWEMLIVPYGGISPCGHLDLACAAARSAGADTAKISWLLSVVLGSATQHQRHGVVWFAAYGAAETGNLSLLRWLWGQQGLDVMLTGRGGLSLFYDEAAMRQTLCELVLTSALRHDHVAVAEWLVDEVGCPLPLEQEPQRERGLVWGAAGDGGSGEAVRWLLDRGVPVHAEGLWHVVKAGKLETVRLLHEDHGVPLTERVFGAAAGSRSVPTATWLLQAGCPTYGPGRVP